MSETHSNSSSKPNSHPSSSSKSNSHPSSSSKSTSNSNSKSVSQSDSNSNSNSNSKSKSHSNSSTNVYKVIVKFLDKLDGPFSANELTDKYGKEFGKSTVLKSLEVLVSKKKVVEKQFGKQKMYFMMPEETDDIKNEMQNVKQNLGSVEHNLKLKEEKGRKLEVELKKFTSIPSTVEMENELIALNNEISILKENFDSSCLKPSIKITQDEAKEIEKRYDKYLSTYRKRKRICNDMLEGILEGYPKTKKHLIDEIGIETDEMVDFKI